MSSLEMKVRKVIELLKNSNDLGYDDMPTELLAKSAQALKEPGCAHIARRTASR